MTEAVSNFLGFELPGTSDQGLARRDALAEALKGDLTPTSLVSFSSEGVVAVVGPLATAEETVGALDPLPSCVIVASDGGEAGTTDSRIIGGQKVPVVFGRPIAVDGFLGKFTLTIARGSEEIDLAKSMGIGNGYLDVVLDLSREPILNREVLPAGYFAPQGDNEALVAACESLGDLRGQFEKPRYVLYNSDICAHGARGVVGCRRCLDVCPADALSSIGESISVETHLCQGMGSCASACPTGALSYAYPNRTDQLNRLRRAIASFREHAETAVDVVFFGGETGEHDMARAIAALPESILPWKLEELGSAGPELWLSCLAYGARSVTLVSSADTAVSVSSEVAREIKETSAILSGLGWADSALALVDADEPLMERSNSLQSIEDPAATMRVATYAGMEEKRTVLRASIDHLVSQAKEPPAEISLPKGSPMGEVQVDSAKCTLCMGCVAVCPAGALLDNKERPCLSFIEWNCVQCGLCENTCPEDAIRLSARLLTDTNARMARRVLNEEEPFKCLDCGKPFTTQSMISRMEEKLSSHRMFQGEGIRKLKLCENCRVKEMFKE